MGKHSKFSSGAALGSGQAQAGEQGFADRALDWASNSWAGNALATDSTLGALAGVGLDAANAAWGNAAAAECVSNQAVGAAGKGLGVLGILGGGVQMVKGAAQWAADDDWGEGIMNIAGGAASAASGGMALAGSAHPAGALLGAFAGGQALGQRGNDWAEKTGVLGQNIDRTNRTFSDLSAERGDDFRQSLVDRGWNEDLALWMGAGATGLASIDTGIGAGVAGAISLGSDGIDLGMGMVEGAADFAGDTWDSAGDAWDSAGDTWDSWWN